MVDMLVQEKEMTQYEQKMHFQLEEIFALDGSLIPSSVGYDIRVNLLKK